MEQVPDQGLNLNILINTVHFLQNALAFKSPCLITPCRILLIYLNLGVVLPEQLQSFLQIGKL